MNAGLPNEQGIGLAVGTSICAAFSQTGWLVYTIALLLLQPPNLAAWLERSCIIMPNVSFSEKENPQIQLGVEPGTM